jgi:hypothetical protein
MIVFPYLKHIATVGGISPILAISARKACSMCMYPVGFRTAQMPKWTIAGFIATASACTKHLLFILLKH